MEIKELIAELERIAPLSFQEEYDNAGLIIGSKNDDVNKALICLDLTEETFEEAVSEKCNLIIAHHPLIFKGLKKINGENLVERIVLKAIQNNIAIYAIHTNLDNVINGVNGMIAEKLKLTNTKILQTKTKLLRKLITFCPVDYSNQVRIELFKIGAGKIGNYDSCSFNVQGKGSFRAGENTNAFVGEKGKLHFENEERIELIYPVYKEFEIIEKLLEVHPYEEVTYDIYPLENEFKDVGAGIIGELEEAIEENVFLGRLQSVLETPCIRHSGFLNRKIKKVAFCGGSGAFLIKQAKWSGADVFVTGDVKYHDFFEADHKLMIADIGHYESEHFTKELIYNILNKKFPTFALRISEKEINPIRYFK